MVVFLKPHVNIFAYQQYLWVEWGKIMSLEMSVVTHFNACSNFVFYVDKCDLI